MSLKYTTIHRKGRKKKILRFGDVNTAKLILRFCD